MPASAIRVFLIDDHPIVEAGLKLGFGLTEDFKLIGTARTHFEAFDRVEDLHPDLILSDLVIDGNLDLNILGQYRALAPHARLVAFSSLPQEAYARKCLVAGADSYVSKSTSSSFYATFSRAQPKKTAPQTITNGPRPLW